MCKEESHVKRIYAAALAALLLLSLAACAAQPSKPAAPDFHAIPFDAALDTLADADGADAFDHSLDHPESRYYVVNDYYNMKSDNDLHIIPYFETYQQTTEHTCGCAAALMVLHHYGVDDYNELEIGERVQVDPEKGTAVEPLAAFFEDLGFNVDVHADTDYRFESIEDAEAYLIEKIDAEIPVMVDWVDWYGHWQTVIGIDTCGNNDPYDDVLILADSYDITDHYQDGYYVFPLGRFFDMWREGPCAQKEVPYEQPFVAAWPKA